LHFEYNSKVIIDLNGGEVLITVSGDQQVFAFSSGLASVILPQFISLLTSFH
jgi:hypothetical protein